MKKYQNLFLLGMTAFLLGVSLAFAFAPFGLFPLAILAPAGLLALWLNRSPKHAFYLGFLFGLGLFGVGVYWIFISVHRFGGVPVIPAAAITGAFFAILSLFPASVGYFTNRYFPAVNEAKMLFAFPALWVLSEWVRSHLLTGFPWLLIGYSQIHSPLKGFAPLLGVYGVSLFALISAGLLVKMILQWKQKKYRSLYLSLLVFIALWTLGGYLNSITWTKPTGQAISISLVQGNIPESLKWSPDHLELSFDRYQNLTEPWWGKSELIIWPEAAIPMPLQDAAPFIDALDQKALENHTQLILGIPMQTLDGKGYYNAIVTVGEEKHVYLKRRLVPFGEYIPFSFLSSRLFNFMNVPIPNLLPGKRIQQAFTLNKTKILPSICYEIAFPELIRSNDPTIGILLTLTNDAWFGKSSAQAQHLEMAAMRAIEWQRPVIFVSNDGITAIIGPDGSILSSVPPRQAIVLTSTVQPMTGTTPWMQHGMTPILLLVLIFLFRAIRLRHK